MSVAVPAAELSFSSAQVAEQIETLRSLLDAADGDCVALFEEQRALFQAGLGANYAAIAEAIEGFDFDKALLALPTAISVPSTQR
jgi:hypothetical protein